MRTNKIITILLTASVFAAVACSTSTPSNEKAASSPPGDAASGETQVIETNANIDLPAATSNRPGGARSIMELSNRRPQPSTQDPSGTPPPLQFRPASENSEVAVSMLPNGSVREIRVFRDHAQLSRVESTVVKGEEMTVTVFLRNGSKREVRTRDFKSLQRATTAEILALVK